MTGKSGKGSKAEIKALRAQLKTAGMRVCEAELPATDPIRLAALHVQLSDGARYIVLHTGLDTDQKTRILRDTLEYLESGDDRPRRHMLDANNGLTAWVRP